MNADQIPDSVVEAVEFEVGHGIDHAAEIIAAAYNQLLTPGSQAIAEERNRQRTEEIYTDEHDDTRNKNKELIRGAETYLLSYQNPEITGDALRWPWDGEGPKIDCSPIRKLEKAGAMIAAEIDRLTRETDYDLPPSIGNIDDPSH